MFQSNTFPRRSSSLYQFLGYEALLFQGLHIFAFSLLIFNLFMFVSEGKLRVPLISAVYLQVMLGLARIVKDDLVSSILWKGK